MGCIMGGFSWSTYWMPFWPRPFSPVFFNSFQTSFFQSADSQEGHFWLWHWDLFGTGRLLWLAIYSEPSRSCFLDFKTMGFGFVPRARLRSLSASFTSRSGFWLRVFPEHPEILSGDSYLARSSSWSMVDCPWVDSSPLGSVFVPQSETITVAEVPTIELVSWFLNSEAHQRCERSRHLCLGPNWWDWDAQVRSLWRDHIDGSREYTLHLVLPEPPRASSELHQAHVIISQIHEPQCATLVTAVYVNSYGDCQLWRAAFALPTLVTDQDIFIRVPQAWRFRAGHVDQCTIFWGEVLFSAIPRHVDQGAGIVLHQEQPRLEHDADPFEAVIVHYDEQPPDNLADVPDFNSLMAMGPPRGLAPAVPDDITRDPAIARDPLDQQPEEIHDDQVDDEDFHLSDDSSAIDDPPWHSSITYSLSKPPCTGRTDWTNHDTLHRTIAENLEVSFHDLQVWYPLNKVPRDLAAHHTQVFVALLHWDILPGEHYRVTLLDVEFHAHGPLRQPEVVREARLLPPRFTRSQLLHFLGLNQYCDQTSPQGCLLWINDRIQLTQHVGFIQVQNGDYVKIAVPPSDALEPDIATRTAAAVCHRGNSLNDAVIWHLTTGLSHDDAILLPLQHPGNTDDLAFMQTHANLVVPHYEFDPQKPWRNHLFELWKQGIRTPDASSTLPKIATFFLDHGKVFRNDVRRLVALSSNFEEWEVSIGQAWADRLDATREYRIDCVFPHPLTMDHCLIGYVLITQNCDPTKASALFSVYDSEVNAWVENQVALVIPRITMKQHLIEICGLAQKCLPRGTHECHLQHADRTFSEHDLIPTEMGIGFSIEVTRTQEECSQVQTPPQDDIALLQTKLQTTFQKIGILLQEKAYENWLNVCSLEDYPPGLQLRIPENPADDIARIVQANEDRAVLAQQEARFFQLTQVPPRLHRVFETLQADLLRNQAPEFRPCI